MPLVKLRTLSYGVSKVEHVATLLNSACAVAVVYSKVEKVRGNFVEDEYYQKATEFQKTSISPVISVTCA